MKRTSSQAASLVQNICSSKETVEKIRVLKREFVISQSLNPFSWVEEAWYMKWTLYRRYNIEDCYKQELVVHSVAYS